WGPLSGEARSRLPSSTGPTRASATQISRDPFEASASRTRQVVSRRETSQTLHSGNPVHSFEQTLPGPGVPYSRAGQPPRRLRSELSNGSDEHQRAQIQPTLRRSAPQKAALETCRSSKIVRTS